MSDPMKRTGDMAHSFDTAVPDADGIRWAYTDRLDLVTGVAGKGPTGKVASRKSALPLSATEIEDAKREICAEVLDSP